MDDDFNTGGALGELFEIVHTLNRMAGGLTKQSPAGSFAEYRSGMTVLKELSQILGLFSKPPAPPKAGGDG